MTENQINASQEAARKFDSSPDDLPVQSDLVQGEAKGNDDVVSEYPNDNACSEAADSLCAETVSNSDFQDERRCEQRLEEYGSDGAAKSNGKEICQEQHVENADALACSNAELGKRGEDAACSFLKRRGFTILERNWVCSGGEADIIAQMDNECCREIHFIEVKTRRSTSSGFPSEAVDRIKRKRYELISEIYLQQTHCDEAFVTFDIISILVTAPDRAYLRMHRNVFSNDCR